MVTAHFHMLIGKAVFLFKPVRCLNLMKHSWEAPLLATGHLIHWNVSARSFRFPYFTEVEICVKFQNQASVAFWGQLYNNRYLLLGYFRAMRKEGWV